MLISILTECGAEAKHGLTGLSGRWAVRVMVGGTHTVFIHLDLTQSTIVQNKPEPDSSGSYSAGCNIQNENNRTPMRAARHPVSEHRLKRPEHSYIIVSLMSPIFGLHYVLHETVSSFKLRLKNTYVREKPECGFGLIQDLFMMTMWSSIQCKQSIP